VPKLDRRKPLHRNTLQWWAHQDSNLGPTDYERELRGRRFELFLKRRPDCCPPLPPASTVSVLFRTISVPCMAKAP
jgi:hypothetical protein